MKVTSVRSDSVYEKIMYAPAEKKNDIYRYELMMPFRTCFDYRSIPMKAASPGGYDVVMASTMLGHLPPVRIQHSCAEEIKAISRMELIRAELGTAPADPHMPASKFCALQAQYRREEKHDGITRRHTKTMKPAEHSRPPGNR